MSEPTPLPFVYQFAAGAIAGVSEVRNVPPLMSSTLTRLTPPPDSGHVNTRRITQPHELIDLTPCQVPIGCCQDTYPVADVVGRRRRGIQQHARLFQKDYPQ